VACEALLAHLRGGGTPGSVQTVIAELTSPGQDATPVESGFRER
jgi:hypothetical protein